MDEQAAKKLAHAVVEAENAAGEKGRDQADDLLSRHFIRLTRGGKPERGEQEVTREQFLAGIEERHLIAPSAASSSMSIPALGQLAQNAGPCEMS